MHTFPYHQDFRMIVSLRRRLAYKNEAVLEKQKDFIFQFLSPDRKPVTAFFKTAFFLSTSKVLGHFTLLEIKDASNEIRDTSMTLERFGHDLCYSNPSTLQPLC